MKLKNFKLYRAIKGGTWAKLFGEWYQADSNGWIYYDDYRCVHMIYTKISERECYNKHD